MPRCSLRCARGPSAQGGGALSHTPPVELRPGERKETARRPGRSPRPTLEKMRGNCWRASRITGVERSPSPRPQERASFADRGHLQDG